MGRWGRLLTAATLFASLSGFSAAEQRYAVTYSVSVSGVETSAGRVVMSESGQARMESSDDQGGYTFNAALSPTEDGLMLNTELWQGATKIAEPTLTFAKGGVAKMVLGDDQQRVVVEIIPAD
jgi:hypothetical protein